MGNRKIIEVSRKSTKSTSMGIKIKKIIDKVSEIVEIFSTNN